MKEQTFEDTIIDEQLGNKHSIIVYNDDVNTFDHVINSLIEVCSHDPIQAEQCTWIIHNNGKCDVKSGDYNELEPMCTQLLNRQINAEIE